MSVATAALQTNPFPGLRPFREEEEYLFFGRENQVDSMVDKLAATRFLAVVGTSGSGKSSLVNCGLCPALHGGLMARAGTSWRMAQFRPGIDPQEAMARALAKDGVLFHDPPAGDAALTEIVDTTLHMSKLGLVDIVEQARLSEGINLLVVVDQFEELFRYQQIDTGHDGQGSGKSEQATAFVNLLLAATEQTTQPIYVVLTMRSDFLGDCAKFPGLAEAINAGQYLVPRMTRDERRAAITGPISIGGAEVSPLLLTRLVNDVGDNPDQLSILQHALNRTWAYWENEGGGKGELELAHYEAIGSMAHALDQHAEKAYKELGTERQQLICEKLFQALTDKAMDPRGVRRPTSLGTLCALADASLAEVTEVIDVFRTPGRAFLMPPAGEALTAETIIDISHESLMRVWHRLNSWADEETRSAWAYRRLAETAVLYAKGQVGLWRDPELQGALDWRDRSAPNEAWASRYHPAFAAAMDFLVLSTEAREAEQAELEAQRQREFEVEREKAETQARYARRMHWLATFAGALAMVAVVFLVRAIEAEKEANEQTRTANSGRLANASLALRMDRPDLSSLFALEAMHTANTFDTHFDARNALLLAVQSYSHLETFLLNEGGVISVAFAPDGRTLASGGRDKTVRLWRLGESGVMSLGEPLAGHEGTVSSVVFASDGSTLASGDLDGTVRLWRLGASGWAPLGEPLTGHAGEVLSVAFAPDGSTLVSVGEDGMLRFWRLGESGVTSLGEPLTSNGGWLWSVAFAPDGNTLASGGKDGTVRLWRLGKSGTWALDQTLKSHADEVSSVAFAPDGSTLASGGKDGTVRLWRLGASGWTSLGKPLTGHEGWVFSVAFASDGTLASGGEDGTVRLWRLGASGVTSLGEPLTGHKGRVRSIAFTPDGSTLASGRDDGTVWLWRLGESSTTTLGEPLTGHEGRVYSVAFAPDGRTLASAGLRDLWGEDGTVWLSRFGESGWTSLDEPLTGHKGVVYSVAFAPDGATLATGGKDGTVRLWKLGESGWTLLGEPLTGHEARVFSVAFAPDGSTLASASSDGTVRLWKLGEAGATRFGEPLTGIADELSSLAFAPDGKTLAAGSMDRTVRLWKLGESGWAQFGEPLTGNAGWLSSLAFAPDGSTLAAGGSDGTVRLWKLGEAGATALDETLKSHKGRVSSVAFAADGSTLASGGKDGTVSLWRLGESGAWALDLTLKSHKGGVKSVDFAPDGRTLVSGSEDRTVRLWRLDVESWRAVACRRASRNFSLAEWQKYIGPDEPYRLTCPALPPGEGVV